MYSAEQEEVVFRKEIYPVGNVEDWMSEIERVMRETLRQIIRDALDDYREVSSILIETKRTSTYRDFWGCSKLAIRIVRKAKQIVILCSSIILATT